MFYMANTKGSNSGTRKRKYNRTNKTATRKNAAPRIRSEKEKAISSEITLLVLLVCMVLLFLCNFGVIGVFGNAVSTFMFGVFGLFAYIAPVAIFVSMAFMISNPDNLKVKVKVASASFAVLFFSALLHLFTGKLSQMTAYSIKSIYQISASQKTAGGIFGGSLAYFFFRYIGKIGSFLFLLVLFIICIVIITEKSFVNGVKQGSNKVYRTAKDDAAYRREQARTRRQEKEQRKAERLEQERQSKEEKNRLLQQEEDEKILRMDKKVSGVMLDTTIREPEPIKKENIHEITLQDIENTTPYVEERVIEPVSMMEEKEEFVDNARQDMFLYKPGWEEKIVTTPTKAFPNSMSEITLNPIQNESVFQDNSFVSDTLISAEEEYKEELYPEEEIHQQIPQKLQQPRKVENTPKQASTRPAKPRPYHFPPISYLKKMTGNKGGDSGRQLQETAMRLQQTLKTFGVNVTITDISKGPAVTRYEMQPEVGVKVSKIVSLADDIKLNLAATDIRIEAPIPGKAAVGIEVPNKENSAVGLRELIESKEFQEFPSKLAFAVGKDISGKVVVTDIAKMPHMLIAGSTGSGKSVCINTLIMSILYKAKPDEVKLIMVDPKVVELSVYNGIPHLMIPVVTDPKKAAAALHWGVAEMTDRYQKFADFGVRDLKGYNKEIENRIARGEAEESQKLPQIVIIVDELADLMMVAPGEVEESICRLAQLARAAGIHLIIATQRPSVDVITGLIKANMPSRVAFAVSSGVDSRTILDMNGAEKLLGKGDMLFYPQGYPKPARVQGSFVSDEEVSDIVDFLKNQAIGNVYDEAVLESIQKAGASGGSGAGSDGGNEKDEYFIEAGKFIIDKDKASIGMLQRVFKIGFNRAARIMDQLADAGVVGEEEGTKPRKVLMSMEQFENYIDEFY